MRRALLALAALGVGAAALALRPPPTPTFAAVRGAHHPSDVPLLDRHGVVIDELRTDRHERRLAWVPLAAVAPALPDAVVAAEDHRFRAHHGVDFQALAGALVAAVRGGPRRGASTITMQLAALLDPTLGVRRGGRSLAQKWRQMRQAWAFERSWSKDEILEAYLNSVGFRGELVGVGAASRLLFGKSPDGLAPAEAATLAALLHAPNASARAVEARARTLADPPAEHADAITTAVRNAFVAPAIAAHVSLAPHAAARLLAGAAEPVRSTLDGAAQSFAAASLRRNLLDLAAAHVRDGAVLVADNASGDVLAYVGGSGRLSAARFVDAVRARRQPGSTLKPFLYSLGLERRLVTAAALVEDTPLEIATAGGLYRPRDYDEQFRGLVSVRTALASSLNVPAVRTLGLVGGEAFLARLRALGFDGLDEDAAFYGPSLALGSADVTLWNLVNAYRTLANGGLWTPLRLVPADASPPVRVVDERAAFLVSDVLADRESRSGTFGLESALATPFWAAVKTGTSREMRDNWCVGYSERYTVGVWVGNASGEPMHDVSGVAGAAPVWTEVMSWLHRATPSAAPAPPAGVVERTVAFPGAVEPGRREWFVAGTEPPATGLAAATPRIVAPVGDTIVALDPDLPAARERVALRAEGADAHARWRVDGTDAGAAATPALWKPRPGAHVIALVDGEGRTLDATRVEVRGADQVRSLRARRARR